MDTETMLPQQSLGKAPSALVSVLQCKCPRCRSGKMFAEHNPYKWSRMMKMNPSCPVCSQPFELEVGFYYGSAYISYALGVAISVASLIAWWVLICLGVHDNRIFYWLTCNAVLLVALQPLLMRLARGIWLYFFVKYDKDWPRRPPEQLERTNREQGNNW